MKRILVTGALGQIGSELVVKLRKLYGEENVLATDIREPKEKEGLFQVLDVTEGKRMYELAKQFHADSLIHMAALLSATAEKNPLYAWQLNMGGLINALEVSRELNLQF
ncbi:NAD-dependent epimerase/dehydratase family protein, partial [Butyricicoccus sp. 1XD8-22]